MAHGAGLAISSSPRPRSTLLLLVVVAVSAAACLYIASAAPDVTHAGADPRLITSGRFLASMAREKKGDACRAGDPGACSGGGRAAPGEHLNCCGRTCTDVLASRNNCGACGARCPFGQLCCGGRCTAVAYDAENCGACRRACPAGVRCKYGMCGYA